MATDAKKLMKKYLSSKKTTKKGIGIIWYLLMGVISTVLVGMLFFSNNSPVKIMQLKKVSALSTADTTTVMETEKVDAITVTPIEEFSLNQRKSLSKQKPINYQDVIDNLSGKTSVLVEARGGSMEIINWGEFSYEASVRGIIINCSKLDINSTDMLKVRDSLTYAFEGKTTDYIEDIMVEGTTSYDTALCIVQAVCGTNAKITFEVIS